MNELNSFETILRRRAELGRRMAAQTSVISRIPSWVEHAVTAAGGSRYANQLGHFVRAVIGPDFQGHHAVLSTPVTGLSDHDAAWLLSYELVGYAFESAVAGAGVQVPTGADRQALDTFGNALLRAAANGAPKAVLARHARSASGPGTASTHLAAMRTLAGAVRIAELKRAASVSAREVAEVAGVAALGYSYASAKQPSVRLLPAYTIAFALSELERASEQNPAFTADIANRLTAAFRVLPATDEWSKQYLAYSAPRLFVTT